RNQAGTANLLGSPWAMSSLGPCLPWGHVSLDHVSLGAQGQYGRRRCSIRPECRNFPLLHRPLPCVSKTAIFARITDLVRLAREDPFNSKGLSRHQGGFGFAGTS